MNIPSIQKTRILFVGEIISSHAQSWMGLLGYARESFEILSFGVPGSPYPSSSKYPVFLKNSKIITNNKVPTRIQHLLFEYAILKFKPHIIHTFGAFPTSAFYAPVIRKYKNKLKWVLQVRGGPDVYMNSFDKAKRNILKNLFTACDALIADNDINYAIAKDLGISPSKCWEYGIAPGTGGIDITDFSKAKKPSQSECRIVWPKAYEGYESKGFPVLEGIKIAWPSIRDKNVKFTFAASNSELNDRLRFLPDDILNSIDVKNRIPRDEMLELMMSSRVVMAPSLLEGIPNTLYESMAARCVPIFSPLDTYKNKFIDGKNVLYARNLYPDEISGAIIKAVNNDNIADNIADENIELVQKIANRKIISENIVSLYKTLSNMKD